MLQQILKDMYIDPELLAELPEDQKQYLFDKMRMEQVRRWHIREKEENTKEKQNLEQCKSPKNGKKVEFKTGLDGNEWVWVMGEHPNDKSIEEILEEEAELKAVQQAEREIRKELEEEQSERRSSEKTPATGDSQEKVEEKMENIGVKEEKIKDMVDDIRETEVPEVNKEEKVEANTDAEVEEQGKEEMTVEFKEEEMEEEKRKPSDEDVNTQNTAEIKKEEEEKIERAKKNIIKKEEEEIKKKKKEEKDNRRKREEEKERLRKEKKESEEKKKAKEEEKEIRKKEKEEEKENMRKKKKEEKAAKRQSTGESKVTPADKEEESVQSPHGVVLRSHPPVSEEEKLRKLIMRRSREILFDFKSVRARFEQVARTDAKEVKRHWKQQEEKARAMEAELRLERRRARAEQAHKPEPEALFNLQLLQAEPAGSPLDESPAKTTKPTRPSPRGPVCSPPVPPRPRVTRRPANRQAALLWFLRQQKPRGAGIDPSSRAPFAWFHGLISRAEAEARLEEEVEGSFLIRISERLFGYAVSVRDLFRCKHFLVEALESGYRLFGVGEHRVHVTLADFVNYHERHALTALGEEKLLFPVVQTFDSPTGQEAFYVEFFPERPNQDIASNL